MAFINRLSNWLERRWVAPAYVGWVLLGLALFFFAAATNTLAGWLYVMSGVLLALLILAAVLPPRNLRGIKIQRQPIQPVSAGEILLAELRVTNTRSHPLGLFQVIDQVPASLGRPPYQAFGTLAAGQSQIWQYDIPTSHRGMYQWQVVDLRSAAPLGLFWCRRSARVPASVMIYPQILPLQRCPILDNLGEQSGQQWRFNRNIQQSTEGITRSLRPYRWGDPTRLIHWRTSARYGELRVRELERVIAGQEVLIGLDTAAGWQAADFEQAVVAAASLFAYAFKRGLAAALWLSHTSELQGYVEVLSALAMVQPLPSAAAKEVHIHHRPMIWLTHEHQTITLNLPAGSCQLCWTSTTAPQADDSLPTLWITAGSSLQEQLQSSFA